MILRAWFKSFWRKPSAPLPKEGIRAERPPNFFDEVASRTPDRSFDHFTPRLRQALILARKEAERLNHDFVGTEHVLLGLIRLGQGVAANLFRSKGLNLDTARIEIEKHFDVRSRPILFNPIPFTPRTMKILSYAEREAKACRHTYVGTEHLLLGLLRDSDSVAARILNKHNVDYELTRRAVLKDFERNPPAQS